MPGGGRAGRAPARFPSPAVNIIKGDPVAPPLVMSTPTPPQSCSGAPTPSSPAGSGAGRRRRHRARSRPRRSSGCCRGGPGGKPAELPVHDRDQPDPGPLAQDRAGTAGHPQRDRGRVRGPGGLPGAGRGRRDLIASLPPRLRDPFLLHYYAGFGIREVAALLHRPEGTIKADLFAARAKLKTALGERDADRRDDLDSWLDGRIDPLPPPPGTFELIKRRARRRKYRRLGITAGVAAVIVAAAVTVPQMVILPVLNPTSATGVANGHSSAPAPDRRRQRRGVGGHPIAARRPGAGAGLLSAHLGHLRRHCTPAG